MNRELKSLANSQRKSYSSIQRLNLYMKKPTRFYRPALNESSTVLQVPEIKQRLKQTSKGDLGYIKPHKAVSFLNDA